MRVEENNKRKYCQEEEESTSHVLCHSKKKRVFDFIVHQTKNKKLHCRNRQN